MTEEPSDQEIDAYIDGQLDTEGRFAVEDFLGHHPDRAAQVMGDLGRRSALQLLARDRRPPSPAQLDLARRGRSARSPKWRRWAAFGGLSAAAMIALFFVAAQNPPAYVDDALTSHRVAALRADMDSQVEAPRFNAREIQLATNIAVPLVPADWTVTDVQLFPTERGPALLMAVRTGDGDRMSLFAQREKNGAPEQPDAIREGLQSVAYWRRGDMAYALVGDSAPAAMDATAEALVRDWS